MREDDDTIQTVRQRVAVLTAGLPKSVSVAALGVKSKAPFQLLCTREALIWRTEELARNACDSLERDDFAVAAILTRSVTESAGLAWKLMELLDGRSKYATQDLSKLLIRLLCGTKSWSDSPRALHVLDCLREMDKRVPGVLDSYNALSEIAHPNWPGVAGLYSKNDQQNYITHFGRGLRGRDSMRGIVISAFLGSLDLFEFAYNRVSDGLPAFLAELESMWPEDNKGSVTKRR